MLQIEKVPAILKFDIKPTRYHDGLVLMLVKTSNLRQFYATYDKRLDDELFGVEDNVKYDVDLSEDKKVVVFIDYNQMDSTLVDACDLDKLDNFKDYHSEDKTYLKALKKIQENL